MNGHLLVKPSVDRQLLYRIDTDTNEIDAIIDLGPSAPVPLHLAVFEEALFIAGDGAMSVPVAVVTAEQ